MKLRWSSYEQLEQQSSQSEEQRKQMFLINILWVRTIQKAIPSECCEKWNDVVNLQLKKSHFWFDESLLIDKMFVEIIMI